MRLGQQMAYGLVMVGCLVWTGCSGDATPQPSGGGAQAGHDHDHDHESGKHGGHVLAIGDEDYHAEWTHDEEGKITVYLLDHDAVEDVAIEADSIEIETAVENGESQTFSLAAVRAEGAATASQFELTDKELMTALQVAGEGATATIKLTIAGKDYSAAIEHDHGHAH
jgi:hypothetical protein